MQTEGTTIVPPTVLAWLATCALLAACGTPAGGGAGSVDDDPTPDPAPTNGLECGAPDYPCANEDVAQSVVERGGALLDQAADRIAAGATVADTAAWLWGHDEVVEVDVGASALRFRLAGGRPLWYSELLMGEGAGTVDDLARTPAETWPRSGTPANGVGRLDVVGDDVNDDGRLNQRDPRRALVLSVTYFEHLRWAQENPDEHIDAEQVGGGHAIAALLRQHEAFQDPITGSALVTHLVNDGDAQPIGPQTFATFADYDVIYVATHGDTVCGDVPGRGRVCRSFLFSGQLLPSCSVPPSLGSYLDCMRIHVRDVNQDIVHTFYGLAISSDFLRTAYPNGFDNMIVWLNACSLFHPDVPYGDTPHDFVELLRRGENSLVFGWTDLVDTQRASDAASVFFGLMASYGVRTAEAFKDDRVAAHDHVNSAGRTTRLVRFGRYVPPEHHLQPLASSPRPDLRLREIVTVTDDEGVPLRDGASLTPFVDGVAGDGREDSLNLLLRIDGVLEHELRDFVIRLEFDRRPIGRPTVLADAEPLQLDEYSYEATLEAVSLGLDLEPGRSYELEAIVDLPEGGDSRFAVDLVAAQGCWLDATIEGARNGRYEGPAGYELRPDGGDLILHLDGWDFLMMDDDPGILGGHSAFARITVGSALTTGVYPLRQLALAYHPNEDAFVPAGTWTALVEEQPICDGAPCGSGSLVVEEIGDDTLTGRIEATLFGMLASGYDPPPYWTVTYEAEFVAVEGSPSEVDSEYMTCVAAGEDGR